MGMGSMARNGWTVHAFRAGIKTRRLTRSGWIVGAGLSLALAGPSPAALAQASADAPSLSILEVDAHGVPVVQIAPPELPETGAPFSASVPLPPVHSGPSDAPTLATIAPPDLPQPEPYLGRTPMQVALGDSLARSEGLFPARLSRAQRDVLAGFYVARDHQPLWLDGEGWSPTARAVLAILAKAGEDGLNPADYVAPLIDPLPAEGRLRVLAEADLRLSALAVLYARDARGGRVEPSRLSKLITPKLDLPEAPMVLEALARAADPAAALAAYHPPHAGYRTLKTALAAHRAARPSAPDIVVPHGPAVKIGMRDPRVPLVRARFGLGPAEDPAAATTYDERVASAIADFQRQKGLPVSGVLTRQTVAALDGAGRTREADLIANMERWRWLPADLGERHVFVDIPAFTLRVMDKGEAVHATRVIVGKRETPTPIFSDTMRHVIVNPSWYVPPSILKKEFLPNLAKNPNYAAERGYVVVRNGKSISVRQPPGEKNALGYIKFMFPNEHAVYLHDTPNRRLFANETRAYSHGCVRVDQPMRLGEILLGRDEGWTEERLKSLIGKGERLVKLNRTVPIHLTYFTLNADASGRIEARDDLYGVDARLREALGLRI